MKKVYTLMLGAASMALIALSSCGGDNAENADSTNGNAVNPTNVVPNSSDAGNYQSDDPFATPDAPAGAAIETSAPAPDAAATPGAPEAAAEQPAASAAAPNYDALVNQYEDVVRQLTALAGKTDANSLAEIAKLMQTYNELNSTLTSAKDKLTAGQQALLNKLGTQVSGMAGKLNAGEAQKVQEAAAKAIESPEKIKENAGKVIDKVKNGEVPTVNDLGLPL